MIGSQDEGGQHDNRDWHLSLLERRWALGCLLVILILALIIAAAFIILGG